MVSLVGLADETHSGRLAPLRVLAADETISATQNVLHATEAIAHAM